MAGELGLRYGLVGLAVSYATGVSEPEPKEVVERVLVLSAEVLYRRVLRTAAMLEEEDWIYDHGYVYRVEGGVDRADPSSDATIRGSP